MRFLYYYVLIFVCICYTDAALQIRSIASGTSFGMCFGYCQQTINITAQPLKVLTTERSNRDDETHPPLRKTFQISSEQWDRLVSSVDLTKFRALPDHIGCPDCADGGAEWIRIDATDGTKQVTFEYRSSVEGIEQFLAKLRQLRNKYLSRLN